MYLIIPNVLNQDQLATLKTFLDGQDLVDGGATAGRAGVGIKSNLQVPVDAKDYRAMEGMVANAVNANGRFVLAAMPRHLRPIRFARYSPGMFYGRHIDNAVMGKNPPSRIDLAFTLFLSPPDTYEGGELAVEEPGTRRMFKLPAGALVLYDGNSLHEVVEVTSGNRDVAVGWLQSMVRDPVKRRVLYELEELRNVMFDKSGRSAEFDTLSRNVADLWRMWVEI